MDPWIGSDSGICLSRMDRSKWYPWMVLSVPWIHGLDRTVGYACLVWTEVSGVHGWSYTCSMDPWIGSDSGICLSRMDRSKWCPWMVLYLFHGSMDWIGQWDMPVSYGQEYKWCPWMVLPVPWIHGLDRTVGYACLVWTGVSDVHGWSYLFHGSMDWIGQWDMPVSYGQE